jgi:hypothetical protein
MLRCEWLSGDRLMRNYFASATIAPGKSSSFLAEAIAVALGRDLPGTKPRQRCRVWCWNGENPADEIDRRIAAICVGCALRARTLRNGWLHVGSRLCIAGDIHRGHAADYLHFSCVEALKRRVRAGPGTSGRRSLWAGRRRALKSLHIMTDQPFGPRSGHADTRHFDTAPY